MTPYLPRRRRARPCVPDDLHDLPPPITHYPSPPGVVPIPAARLISEFLRPLVPGLFPLLQPAPPPSQEAEERAGAERRPREPDERRIGLRLPAAMHAIDIRSDAEGIATDASIDNGVVGELAAGGIWLVAAAADGDEGGESLRNVNVSLAMSYDYWKVWWSWMKSEGERWMGKGKNIRSHPQTETVR